MAGKLFNLITFTTLALFASILTADPVNALSTGHHHLNRQVAHEHIAKRNINNTKRANTKRCKARPSSISVEGITSHIAATSKASSIKPVVTSASHSVAPPPPPPNNGGGSGKVGLAWPNGPDPSLANYATDAVRWIYSWSPYTPDPNHKYHMEYLPQLWGPNQIDDFEKVVQAGYANIVLGFNEPNEKGQSNLDPGYAAQLWQQHIEPKRAKGYQTCSPATSSNPNGFTWVQNFLKACNGGCTLDYICIHWYDVKAADFKTYAEKWHNEYNKDIFITEFAPQNFNGGAQPSVGDIWAFYQEVMPWIMQTSWIKGAFPFGFMHGMDNVNLADQLMASDGKPTALGAYIIGGNY